MKIQDLFGNVRSALMNEETSMSDLIDQMLGFVEIGHIINESQFDSMIMPYIIGHMQKRIIQPEFWGGDNLSFYINTGVTEALALGQEKLNALDLFQMKEIIVNDTWPWMGMAVCGHQKFKTEKSQEYVPIVKYIYNSQHLDVVHFRLENNKITNPIYNGIMAAHSKGRRIGFMPTHMTNDGGDYLGELSVFISTHLKTLGSIMVTTPEMSPKRLEWCKSKAPQGVIFR